MQVLMPRSIYHLKLVNKHVVRSVSASAVKEDLKSWEEIPTPSSLPIIGQIHHFLPGGRYENPVTLQEKFYKDFGPIAKINGIFSRPANLILFDPESAAQVLRSENWLPIRPGFESLKYYRQVHKKKDKTVPTGLLSDDGDVWKKLRTAANPVLMQPKIAKLYSNRLAEIADEMIDRIKLLQNDADRIRKKFDIEMQLWALESIAMVALGCRLNCFDPNLPEDSPEKKLIRCIGETFAVTQELDFKISMWKWFATPTFKRGMKLYAEHENLAKYFIRKSIEELKAKENSNDEKGVVEKLFEIDEDTAVVLGTDMLFAGIDTTTNAMLGILYLLAVNPEKQNKLRDELTSHSDQKPYLKACFKESTRMMPIAPGNMRMSTKEYNLLGYRIPKDIYIIIGHQYMSVIEKYFPKPRNFIPERWIDKESPLYYGSAHPFAYSPFGFGVRACIGRRIAELEMEILLTKIIQNFRVEWIGPPPEIVMNPINVMLGPYNFVFKNI